MKQTKTTKRAVLTSALSLLLCCTMLIGTTWAWFTDSVTSSGNIIKSGTLDVEMFWADGKEVPNDTATWTDASTGAIFNWDKWEPGYVDVKHIKIENKGTLALKYKVVIKANGDVSDLADVIEVYYIDPAVQVANRAALVEDAKLGMLSAVLADNVGENTNTAEGVLYPDGTDGKSSTDTITIALKMQETAGNQYQNKSIGTDFSVQLLATQYTYEEDTFGNDYDTAADAKPDNEGWPYANVSTKTADSAAAPFEITSDIATVSVPAGAFETGDKFELAVSDVVTNDSAPPAISIAFDLMLRRNGVAVKEETDGVEYTVSLQLEKYLAIDSVKHNGENVAYSYDINTGIMTLTVKHFSPFEIKAVRNEDVVVAATEEAVQEVVADFNNGEYAVAKDASEEEKEPVMVALANATYTESIVIKQYPDYDEATQTALTDPSRANIVEFVGGEDTVITGNVTVYGSHNGQSSNTGDFKGDGCVIFKNITFDGSTFHDQEDDMIININEGSKEVVFENCTFKNSTYIGLGSAGKSTSGYITFKNCTFDGAACLSGYCYNLTLENCSGSVDGGKGKGFINIQNSGKVLVKDCDIDIGEGAYAFRTTNNMSAEITVIDSAIRAAEGSTKPLVVFRGTNGKATFTNCTLFTETVDLKNGATASQLTVN